MEQRDIENQQRLIGVHRNTLQLLLIQQAQLGLYTPPYVIHAIREARTGIAHHKAVLRGWAVAIEDHPDDEDIPPAAPSANSAVAPCPAINQQITFNQPSNGPVGVFHESVTINQIMPAPVPHPKMPRQLPSPDAPLIGRAAMTEAICAQVEANRQTNACVIGIDGPAGVGKTTFAIHFAHQIGARYPDGQIFLPLHGVSESSLSPDQALRKVINAFEQDCHLADDLDALEAHYRSLLNDKHVLILADDVPDLAHIQALNPPPGSMLLITSRKRFFGRVNISWRALGPLAAPDAVELLRTNCERLSETEAATIADLCGYLPLALCISAGLLTNDPGRSITRYIADLSHETTRLHQLRNPDAPDMNIEAVLAISYQALPAAEQAGLAQISVFAADFDYDAATAVVELPDGINHENLLSHLRLNNLLTYVGDDRNSMHNLIRIFARRKLTSDAVYLRYARHYAARAQRMYAGFPDNGADLDVLRHDWPHIETGWAWTVTQRQQPDVADLLLIYAEATLPVFDCLCARDKRLALLEPIPMLAGRAGNRALQAATLIACGDAALHHIDPAGLAPKPGQAHAYYAEALTIAPDQRNEARAYIGLGLADIRTGDLKAAIRSYLRGRSLARDIDDQHIYCLAQSGLGNAFVAQGRIADAVACYQQGLHLASNLDDQRITVKLLRDQSAAYLAWAAAVDWQSSADERRACLGAADTSILQSRAIARAIGDLEGKNESYWQRDLLNFVT